MKRILKVLGLLVVLAIVAIALTWWWYLRADSMEMPTLPGTAQTGSMQYEGHRRTWLAYVPASKPAATVSMCSLSGTGLLQSTRTDTSSIGMIAVAVPIMPPIWKT